MGEVIHRVDILREPGKMLCVSAPRTFAPDEWYHCYNRGIDGRKTFENTGDYDRFVELLYLANSDKDVRRSDLSFPHEEIFLKELGQPIVSIGAYALMPNHFHLLLRAVAENGVSLFMGKLGNAYTKYFNLKRERIGNLFTKPFRAKHVGDDRYFRHVANYIHCNPAELFEYHWKEGVVKNLKVLEKKLVEYPYSSNRDHHNIMREERAVLDPDALSLLQSDTSSFSTLLREAAEYYRDVNPTG